MYRKFTFLTTVRAQRRFAARHPDGKQTNTIRLNYGNSQLNVQVPKHFVYYAKSRGTAQLK
jgi:hypothetical protein